MSTEAISRDQARELFANSGLTYSVLSPKNLRNLRGKINEQMVASGSCKAPFAAASARPSAMATP